MNNSKQDALQKLCGEKEAEAAEGEVARDALIARLSKLVRSPAPPKPPRSLQPTPEAAKTRLARLRRKQRMLIQKTKRAAMARSTQIPPASDPLSP